LQFERYIADFVFVLRMNRENIRSPARSIANLEFHHVTDEINEVARKIVATLEGVALHFEIDSPGGMSPASKFAVFCSSQRSTRWESLRPQVRANRLPAHLLLHLAGCLL
jgi:hypothetical protein